MLLNQPLGVTGNVRTQFIARWSARGRFLIGHN